ncbi:uncharacterized protein J3R85_006999 [Psidium guajava]|nr:uncharacterized protein J3R85_006999 [Psidium guajava]
MYPCAFQLSFGSQPDHAPSVPFKISILHSPLLVGPFFLPLDNLTTAMHNIGRLQATTGQGRQDGAAKESEREKIYSPGLRD